MTISTKRMQIIDKNTEYLGVPASKLMENAAKGIAQHTRKQVENKNQEIHVIAGTGNNGGDALAATRFLAKDPITEPQIIYVHLIGRKQNISTEIARENLDALINAEIPINEARDSTEIKTNQIKQADIIIDAVLGTGIKGETREPAKTAINAINQSNAYIISVDIPSGINSDTAGEHGVNPSHILTFHDKKPAHNKLDTQTTIIDIGIPPLAERITGPGDLQLINRSPDSHKGQHGDILIIGGGPYSGAPALTAQAALRAGADIARVATPSNVADTIKGYSENLIVHTLDGDKITPSHTDTLIELIKESSNTVIGPGIGSHPDTQEAIHQLIPEIEKAVLDAEAIQGLTSADKDSDIIITPHRGELRKHIDNVPDDWRERAKTAEEFSEEHGVTTLLKGEIDIISNGESTRINKTGNPGMTVGGTGDILAGITAALQAVLDSQSAACIAAYTNGRAGDLAAKEKNHGFVATDLLRYIPRAMTETDITINRT